MALAIENIFSAGGAGPLSPASNNEPIVPVRQTSEEQLLARLEDLSEEEVDRLLGDLASEGASTI
jgi:hypothetical protein